MSFFPRPRPVRRARPARLAALLALAAALGGRGAALAAPDDLDQALDALAHERALFLVLSGDKPFTLVTPPPVLDYEKLVRRLDEAKASGAFANKDLGWFIAQTADAPIDTLPMPDGTSVGVGHQQLYLFSRIGVARLLATPELRERLGAAGVTGADAVDVAVERLRSFLERHFRQKAAPPAGAADLVLGTIFGFPTEEVTAFGRGRPKRNVAFRTVIDGEEFVSDSFSSFSDEPTATEREQRRHFEAAARRYHAERALHDPLAVVGRWPEPPASAIGPWGRCRQLEAEGR
jgi:hypothetical protein